MFSPEEVVRHCRLCYLVELRKRVAIMGNVMGHNEGASRAGLAHWLSFQRLDDADTLFSALKAAGLPD